MSIYRDIVEGVGGKWLFHSSILFQVITVLMKSMQREVNLCQSSSPLLATVYLFCGDELSRQQFRR